MKDNKNHNSKVQIFLQRESFNALITVLTTYEKACGTNKYGAFASSLKETLLRDSRIVKNEGIDNVLIYLFNDEAAVLIKLTAIYFNTIGKPDNDYFSQIKKRK